MSLADTAALIVQLTLEDKLSGGLTAANAKLDNFGKTVSKVGSDIGAGMSKAVQNIERIALVAGTAAAGIGIAAVKSASDFQKSMTLLETQTGATAEEVKSATQGILDLAPQVATSADTLAAGLYHIESAGIRGAQALDVLKIAAEGAKVGGSDLEATTNALIAEVKSGVGGVTDMSQAMGVLNAIVGTGNMRMQDLVDAMGTGLMTKAATFGASVQSVGAALDSMTAQGIPAVQAATEIGSAFRLMAAPMPIAAKQLESIGLGQLDLANAMRGPGGIVDAIELLTTKMQGAGLIGADGKPTAEGADLLTRAFGGKQSTAILAMVAAAKQLPDLLGQINAGAGGFGDAWAKTQQDFDFEVQQMGAAADALKIKLGTALMPAATRLMQSFSAILSRPEVAKGLTDIGDAVSRAFSQQNIDRAIKFGESVLPTIEGGLKTAFAIAKEAFDIFDSLPDTIKTATVAAFGLNKLTGGMVVNVTADIGEGLLKGVAGQFFTRGSSPANPMWVAGEGIGGPGGGGGGGGGGALGWLAWAGTAAAVGTAIVGAASTAVDQTRKFFGYDPKTMLFHGPGYQPPQPAAQQYGPPLTEMQYGPPLSEAGSPGTAIGTALGNAAAIAFNRQTDTLRDQIFKPLADDIAGITERSAAEHGGKALGAAAIDDTFQRNSLREAQQLLNSSQATNDKLAGLKMLQDKLIAHGTAGDRNVAAKIAALESKFQQTINVNVNTAVAFHYTAGYESASTFDRFVSRTRTLAV